MKRIRQVALLIDTSTDYSRLQTGGVAPVTKMHEHRGRVVQPENSA